MQGRQANGQVSRDALRRYFDVSLLYSPAEYSQLNGLSRSWNHLSRECLSKIHDDLLRAETEIDTITAVFQCQSSVPINRVVADVVAELSYFYLILFGFSLHSGFICVETHRNSYTSFTVVFAVGISDLSMRNSKRNRISKFKTAPFVLRYSLALHSSTSRSRLSDC